MSMKYDETTAINYTNTWTSDVDGLTNIINRRQGIVLVELSRKFQS